MTPSTSLRFRTLSIKGEIINTSSGVREVPRLRVQVSDDKDLPIKFWEFSVKVRNLGPGEESPSRRMPIPSSKMQPALIFRLPIQTIIVNEDRSPSCRC